MDMLLTGALMKTRPFPRFAFLLAAGLFAAACRPTTGGRPTGVPVTPTAPSAATVTAMATQPPAATELPPQNDAATDAPDPAAVARLALAADAGLDADDITVVSTGAWTDDAIVCALDLPNDRLATQLDGQHRQVVLSVSGKEYEYWVFDDVGGLMLAFGCER
jgi:hypothetical protein